jgi:hypothetical protein
MTLPDSAAGLVRGEVTNVVDAIALMTEIGAALPPEDGVASFNRMYLTVTTAVYDAIGSGYFANSAFLERLDIVFANRYFVALDKAESGAEVPRCWDVLWRHRSSPARVPLQFAIAGMNAHINHDLVLAVVQTLVESDASPHDEALQADFRRVNSLLATLETAIRRSYEHGLLLRLDKSLGGLEHRLDNWSISVARGIAWCDAELLWGVRNHPTLRTHYERALDHAVALAGECLLVPADFVHEHHQGQPCCVQAPVLPPVAASLAPPAG